MKFNEEKDGKEKLLLEKVLSPPINKHKEFLGWVQNPFPKSQAMEELV